MPTAWVVLPSPVGPSRAMCSPGCHGGPRLTSSPHEVLTWVRRPPSHLRYWSQLSQTTGCDSSPWSVWGPVRRVMPSLSYGLPVALPVPDALHKRVVIYARNSELDHEMLPAPPLAIRYGDRLVLGFIEHETHTAGHHAAAPAISGSG